MLFILKSIKEKILIINAKFLGVILLFFPIFLNDAKASCLTTISVATSALLTCNVGDVLNISSTGSIIRNATKSVDAKIQCWCS